MLERAHGGNTEVALRLFVRMLTAGGDLIRNFPSVHSQPQGVDNKSTAILRMERTARWIDGASLGHDNPSFGYSFGDSSADGLEARMINITRPCVC